MVDCVDATMLLCDAAQVAEGKLYILGAGWNMIGPEPTPSAIALRLEVEWGEVDRPHHWELFLVDEDGEPVILPTPQGPQAVEVRGDFQVGAPPGLPEGSPIEVSLAVNMGPLPLQPGRRYTWRLAIDGQEDPRWMRSFSTRPLPEEAV
jgi:hypothetical protein